MMSNFPVTKIEIDQEDTLFDKPLITLNTVGIENFWDEKGKIVNITAIVGENGTGKTRLLREIITKNKLINKSNYNILYYSPLVSFNLKYGFPISGQYEDLSFTKFIDDNAKYTLTDAMSGSIGIADNNDPMYVVKLSFFQEIIHFLTAFPFENTNKFPVSDFIKIKDRIVYKIEIRDDSRSFFSDIKPNHGFNKNIPLVREKIIQLINALYKKYNDQIAKFESIEKDNNKNNRDTICSDFIDKINELKIEDYDTTVDGGVELSIGKEDYLNLYKAYNYFYIMISSIKPFAADTPKPFIFPKILDRLSSGEIALITLFSKFYDYIITKGLFDEHKNYLLLLDEPDAMFHPEWKRKFIHTITAVFPAIFPGAKLQIIFTTHDPLTLSDMPSSNVIFLKKEGDKTIIADSKEKKTFGANIYELYRDSFFLESYMGEFAQGKINDVITWLNFKTIQKLDGELSEIQKKKQEEPAFKSINEKYVEKIIDMIGEPIMQKKLREMFDFVKPKSQ